MGPPEERIAAWRLPWRYGRSGNGAAVLMDHVAGASDTSWLATALVAAAVSLIMAARVTAAAQIGWREVPFAVAAFVIPMLWAFPPSRQLAGRYRWWLLAAQAVVTWVPAVLFGTRWVGGISGLLAGLALLSLPRPLSWLVAGGELLADLAVRSAVTGLPYADAGTTHTWAAISWLVILFVDDGVAFFGMVRLAQLADELRQARERFAALAVAGERAEAEAQVQSAVGERVGAVAEMAAAAWRLLPGNPDLARGHIAAAGIAAREAVARAREVTAARRAAPYPQISLQADRAVISSRLAWIVLVTTLAGWTAANVVFAVVNQYSVRVTAFLLGCTVAVAAVQIYHSRPVPGGARPRGWQLTLALQALLVYAVFLPIIDASSAGLVGFLAGSILLLGRGRWRWPGFAAVVATWTVLFAVVPEQALAVSLRTSPSVLAYVVAATMGPGLVVYGLSWLAGLAGRLEKLQGELARMAVVQERLRVARDVHDLLGLGLSAAALKADLIGRLIGLDNTRAIAEIDEVGRICATARAEMRRVTGDSQRLSLAAELAAARQILNTAGVDVDVREPGVPLPTAAGAVLAVVLREAVTNILRHSVAAACTICLSAAGGTLRLQITNDGVPEGLSAGQQPGRGPAGHRQSAAETAVDDRPGSGLANLAARVAAAGGRLTSSQTANRFDLVAEIPVPVLADSDGAAPDPAALPSL